MTSVTIASSGLGVPVRPVDSNAPSVTLTDNGAPIVISDRGAPFIIDGYNPEHPIDFNWQMITLTAGEEGQWLGFSDGGATRPQPGFGAISGQPSDKTDLLALYDDSFSNVYLAVFSGDWLSDMATLTMAIGGTPFTPFDANVISGNTWIRYNGVGDFVDGADYQIKFG